jgi:hypothetical protein
LSGRGDDADGAGRPSATTTAQATNARLRNLRIYQFFAGSGTT